MMYYADNKFLIQLPEGPSFVFPYKYGFSTIEDDRTFEKSMAAIQTWVTQTSKAHLTAIKRLSISTECETLDEAIIVV